MSDKIILPQHKITIENRKDMQITGVVQVVSYDEYKVTLKTDYGRLVISGKNLVAGEINVENGVLKLSGDIDFLQYQANRGKSEGALGKLFR